MKLTDEELFLNQCKRGRNNFTQTDKNKYTNENRGDVMVKEKSDNERARILSESIWLNYFNRYLFEHGTISEKEFGRMSEKIAEREARSERGRVTC